ncbi:esterase [Romboutsia ilealis]|uniref:Esterase family protein n=1 Tax=Romboutsia faecis TaxID=2764597 RepID=A0ABR7JP15_9FIRM|nr:alpha/beta hydrolase-fold protein [Romboutsia faecis]MBC5996605.1 esterase family protein [Romboutsia faecis]MRN24130.1 esterase [Romboutsia ilealis]
MKKEYFKEFSHSLNRDMEFNVYGHSGKPILVFPAQNGRYYDFEGFNMLDNVHDLIESGKIQLFCCDSIDSQTWSAEGEDCHKRILRHEQWFNYVVNELVPRILQINYESNKGIPSDGIITMGCSMGGAHAVNFMFRRPDIFRGTISLSGYFDSDIFFGDYCDELVYKNAPIKYIEGMNYDHPYVEMYRKNKIIICCGQGAWEGEMLRSIYRIKELLEYKDIPAMIDIWGYDVNHDWDWWKVQFSYFIRKIV